MGKIYFVARTYSPNAASDIRYRSLMEGFKCNDEISFVYLLPDSNKSVLIPTLPNIKVINMWEGQNCCGRLQQQFFLYYNLFNFVRQLHAGDVVVDLACCEILPFLLRKRNVRVYYEISEHPEISLSASRIAPSVNSFLKYSKRLSGLFVISNALKDYFVENGVDESRVHIINMVVDESRFRGLKKNGEGDKIIAYCGTASNNKDGVDQLIKSFSVVSSAYPEYKLMIIGRTPDKDQKFSNLRLVESLGLSNKVIFTGAIPYNQVPQMIVDADILALDRPNNKQAKYGFPTKLGEYLISGNPVVITNVGDMHLFLKHKVNALIAEPDSIDSFSKELIWTIEHPEEAKVIGERGKEVAHNCFNGAIEGERLLRIIKSNGNGEL